MRLIDKLTHPPRTLSECHEVMKEAAHENVLLRSMLFQFVVGSGDTGLRTKAANILGMAHTTEYTPSRITADPMFNSLVDED